jgi:hypothetical protein
MFGSFSPRRASRPRPPSSRKPHSQFPDSAPPQSLSRVWAILAIQLQVIINARWQRSTISIQASRLYFSVVEPVKVAKIASLSCDDLTVGATPEMRAKDLVRRLPDCAGMKNTRSSARGTKRMRQELPGDVP